MRYRLLEFLKWATFGFMLIACIASCTMTKKVNKLKQEVVTEEATKTKETAVLSSSTAITRTITEETDRPITMEPDSAAGQIPIKDLISGGEFELDDENLSLHARYDSASKKVIIKGKTKKKTVSVPGKKTTVEVDNSRHQATINKEAEGSKKTKETNETKGKDVERKGLNLNYLWWLLLLIPILIWYYLPRKK